MTEWIVAFAAVGTLGIAGMAWQRGVMNARTKRAVDAAIESTRIDGLTDRLQLHEADDRKVHREVDQHAIEIRVLRESAQQNRQDHRLIFEKLDEVGKGVAKLINGDGIKEGA